MTRITPRPWITGLYSFDVLDFDARWEAFDTGDRSRTRVGCSAIVLDLALHEIGITGGMVHEALRND